MNTLKTIKNIFKKIFGSVFKVIGSDELDSLKIALVTSLLISATKGAIKPEEAELLAVQIVGIVDGLSNEISEDLK